MSNTPAFETFCVELRAALTEAGIKFSEPAAQPSGWVKFELGEGGEKLYVPRNKGVVGKLHTTLMVPLTVAGAVPPKDNNGKIQMHLEPNIELVIAAIAPLVEGSKLRANKAPVRKTV